MQELCTGRENHPAGRYISATISARAGAHQVFVSKLLAKLTGQMAQRCNPNNSSARTKEAIQEGGRSSKTLQKDTKPPKVGKLKENQNGSKAYLRTGARKEVCR
jgi:hypothetical protein